MGYKSFRKEVMTAITKAEKSALEEVGFFVEAEAKVRTPVVTGTLKRSITSVVDANDKSVVIGTNVEYASSIEKGTSKRKGRPYLTPAVEENESKLKSILEKHLKNEVR